MGNTPQTHQNIHNNKHTQQANINNMQNQLENSIRCSFGENLADHANVTEPIIIGKGKQGRAHKSLDSRNKQKLSLSKDANSQSSMRLQLNRSASNDCRGIGLTQIEKTVSQYRTSLAVNKPAQRFNNHLSEQVIKKVPIRPRDLPRKISTQKMIIFPQPTIKRVPLEPKIIINPPASSPCIINYVKQASPLTNSKHSLQSSIVTPFVPAKTATACHLFIQNPNQPKKLKKVAMNRSHTNYNHYERGQNNGQESEPNKQNQKKIKGQSLLIESRYHDESSGQHLFTDPKLYTYITNKQHPCSNEIRNKYAVPTYENIYEPKKDNLQHHQVPSIQISPPRPSAPLRLEQAIPDEVESRPLIEADFFRFPTLTDFSEDSKTDNTSFIPIIRNNSSQKQQLEGEELLKYCRPKIDEMVLADLRKLPIKN